MALTIANRSIRRVVVVDDSKEARENYEYPLEELGLEVVYEEGPLDTVERSVERLRAKADAIVCDYHLRKRNFSPANGDQLVALFNLHKVPALLCTTYADSDITVMRSKRRFIPSLLKPAAFVPDLIVKGLERCVLESENKFEASRKPWRTLVRVADVDEGGKYFYVVVPGWDAAQKIRIYLDDTPQELQPLVKINQRFHAIVNVGANSPDELYFTNWEPS
jgi:CheY-like chemotaxis protein